MDTFEGHTIAMIKCTAWKVARQKKA